MLYLAEVQRKGRSVLGSGKAEFRLLACQRSEQTWSPVPGDEKVSAPDDANYNDGVLVMLELTASKQVQRHSDAGRQLVSILQNFSRLQEKAKTQEEEIEQWKQSLTYQSQELNRREMEMEARQEQLQQMEEDFARLEQQQQELEGSRQELEQLRNDFERKSQELEGAWAHLRGEMGRLEERQSELQQSTQLDEAQAQQIQELLNRLSGAIAPTESVRDHLNQSFEFLSQQQNSLDLHLPDLEQQCARAQQLQTEVDGLAQQLQTGWQDWYAAQKALEQTQLDLTGKQSSLSVNERYAQTLSVQLQSQDASYSYLYDLAASTGKVGTAGAKVDAEALEKMSLSDLETLVRNLEKELEKLSQFVSSQEEELTLQQQTIDELQAQIQDANEYDRMRIESELTDERESYQMLNKTLVGQRRTLQERAEILRKHKSILARRQGLPAAEGDEQDIDLSPVITRMEESKSQLSQELKSLEAEIQQLRSEVEQHQATVNQNTVAQETRFNELKQMEQDFLAQRATASELWGKVNVCQDSLLPIQDGAIGLKERVEGIASVMEQFQEVSDYQLQAIAEMRQVILTLTGSSTPEFVA